MRSLCQDRTTAAESSASYGLIADLLECILQRCLSYNTKDCRIAYDYVKACLTNPSVAKVVLIGHSQGGIIASTVLDKLFAELPPATISKLVCSNPLQPYSKAELTVPVLQEVYTFGSAASHFNNPSLYPPNTSSTDPTRSEAPNRCIPHIEHYCNELDMITRWGVLYNVTEILNNRYCGKVFVRMGASGHMFNQHYLDPMFPLDKTRANEFLDQVVDVDEKTASSRESVSAQRTGILRQESALGNFEFGDGSVVPVGDVLQAGKAAGVGVGSGINFVEPSGFGVAEARGKTVRELSRLWRYVNGGIPDGA